MSNDAANLPETVEQRFDRAYLACQSCLEDAYVDCQRAKQEGLARSKLDPGVALLFYRHARLLLTWEYVADRMWLDRLEARALSAFGGAANFP